MSHMESSNGWEDKFSLKHIVNYLKELLGVNVYFSDDRFFYKKTVSELNNGGGVGVGKFKILHTRKN